MYKDDIYISRPALRIGINNLMVYNDGDGDIWGGNIDEDALIVYTAWKETENR